MQSKNRLPVFAGIGILATLIVGFLCIGGVLAGLRLAGRLVPGQVSSSSAPVAASGTQDVGNQFDLQLIKSGDNSLIILNAGKNDIPLSTLQLGNTPSRVYGNDWGVASIKPGECVGVWKNSAQAKLPKGLVCNQVGVALERSGPQRFWNANFNIYYGDKFVGECSQTQQECQIQIAPGG
jgi:hypothetical protein